MLTTDRYKLKPQLHKITGILRIIIYARLSKNRSGLSTNTSIQVTECLDEAQYYARQNGLKLVVVGIYEENDVSVDDATKDFVFQGWKVDGGTRAECLFSGTIPDHEEVIRIPARMVDLIRKACDAVEGS